jgi:hypothetical protein
VDPEAGGVVHHGDRALPGKLKQELRAFATHQFELDEQVDDSKLTLREHLTRAAMFDVRALKQLEGPALDPSMEYIWNWWLLLHTGRTSGGMSPNVITWSDIDAFNRLNHLRMLPEEVALLREVEGAYTLHRSRKFMKTPDAAPDPDSE